MLVKLISHSLINRPDWRVMNDTVPLGMIYEVVGYESKMTLVNKELGEMMETSAYYVVGNGGEGYLPTEVFEPIVNTKVQ